MWTLIPIILVVFGVLAVIEWSNGPPVPTVRTGPCDRVAREHLFVARAHLAVVALGVIGTWFGVTAAYRVQPKPTFDPAGIAATAHTTPRPAGPTDHRTPAHCDSRPTP